MNTGEFTYPVEMEKGIANGRNPMIKSPSLTYSDSTSSCDEVQVIASDAHFKVWRLLGRLSVDRSYILGRSTLDGLSDAARTGAAAELRIAHSNI